jgi:hypothetical protein
VRLLRGLKVRIVVIRKRHDLAVFPSRDLDLFRPELCAVLHLSFDGVFGHRHAVPVSIVGGNCDRANINAVECLYLSQKIFLVRARQFPLVISLSIWMSGA